MLYYKRQKNGDLTSLFCISVNRSGRVRKRTAGVLARDRDGLLDDVSLVDTGALLTLLNEFSESAANHHISTQSTYCLIWQSSSKCTQESLDDTRVTCDSSASMKALMVEI